MSSTSHLTSEITAKYAPANYCIFRKRPVIYELDNFLRFRFAHTLWPNPHKKNTIKIHWKCLNSVRKLHTIQHYTIVRIIVYVVNDSYWLIIEAMKKYTLHFMVNSSFDIAYIGIVVVGIARCAARDYFVACVAIQFSRSPTLTQTIASKKYFARFECLMKKKRDERELFAAVRVEFRTRPFVNPFTKSRHLWFFVLFILLTPKCVTIIELFHSRRFHIISIQYILYAIRSQSHRIHC